MWVCAWIACPSGDASASPVLGSGSSSPDSDFQGLLIPATIYDIIHLLTHFPATELRIVQVLVHLSLNNLVHAYRLAFCYI